VSRVSRAEVALGAAPVVEDAPQVVVESPKPTASKAKAKPTESEESS